MSSISGIVQRTITRLTGADAQTYEGARAELGGAPWREAPKSTDAWFILDEEVAATSAEPRRRGRLAWIGVAGLVATLALTIAVATAGHPPPAAAFAAASATAAAQTPPAPTSAAAAVPSPAAAIGRSDAPAAAPAPSRRPKRGHHHAPSNPRPQRPARAQ